MVEQIVTAAAADVVVVNPSRRRFVIGLGTSQEMPLVAEYFARLAELQIDQTQH